jgi:hypothetical protein
VVWAVYPHDTQVAIAAAVFVPIGVLLLFLVNLIFTQGILRATHPRLGWHPATGTGFKVLYGMIIVMLAIVIAATVDNFFVLEAGAHRTLRDLTITAVSYFVLLSFLPIPITLLSVFVPSKSIRDSFGRGSLRTKWMVLLTSATLLCLGSCYRAATVFKNPRPKDDPAWFDQKWAFYLFNFTVETIVIYLYILFRVDRRFHVRNGSHGPGDYSEESVAREKPQDLGETTGYSTMATRENSQEKPHSAGFPSEPKQATEALA